MCYSTTQILADELEFAKLRGDSIERINQLHQLLKEIKEADKRQGKEKYFAYGFGRPELIVFTDKDPYKPQKFKWGLLQPWHKTDLDIRKGLSSVLNARGETIFELRSFKESAKNRRCLIYVDSFFENHHLGKTTYPFRIQYKDEKPMILGGLWNEWTDISTGEIINNFVIVTTSGNELMTKIHNNPAAEMGARMPVILSKETQNEWLIPCSTPAYENHLKSLIKPLPDGLLKAYTVPRLLGKTGVGNSPKALEHFEYPELHLNL